LGSSRDDRPKSDNPHSKSRVSDKVNADSDPAISNEAIQKYSERFDISSEDSRDLIQRESALMLKLKKLSTDGSNGADVIKDLHRYCSSIRVSILRKEPDVDQNTSRTLPNKFLKDVPRGRPSDEFLAKLDGLKVEEISHEFDFEVRAIMGLINSLSKYRPDLLQEFLDNQSHLIPPTKLDSIIYAAALESIEDNKEVIRRLDIEGFKDLGKSLNPIYRLLGLKIFSAVEADPRSLMNFYDQYAQEHDIMILGTAVQELLKLNSPEAETLVETIYRSEKVQNTPELSNAIKQMMAHAPRAHK
jgi:hypothetical protein